MSQTIPLTKFNQPFGVILHPSHGGIPYVRNIYWGWFMALGLPHQLHYIWMLKWCPSMGAFPATNRADDTANGYIKAISH
jgi:hypothetical protein